MIPQAEKNANRFLFAEQSGFKSDPDTAQIKLQTRSPGGIMNPVESRIQRDRSVTL
jgi:hypothetical protein